MTTPTEKGLARLANQFRFKENFRAFISAFLAELDELKLVQTDMEDNRGLDTAVGAQLTGIGNIVGLERYSGVTDEIFRGLCKVQIMINNTNMMVDSTLEILSTLFEVAVTYQCSNTLEAVYTIYKAASPVELFMLEQLPLLLGIEDVSYTVLPAGGDTFSFFEDPTGKGLGLTGFPDVGGHFSITL